MNIRHRSTIGIYLAAFVVLCDQMSKWYVAEVIMRPPRIMPYGPFANLVLVHNKGVTFGLLSEQSEKFLPYILTAVAMVVIFLLGRWLWRTTSIWVVLGLGAVMGGALGNVIDRIHYGWVIDFIDLYYRDYHWPAFNIADAAIVTGVGLLFLDSLVRAR